MATFLLLAWLAVLVLLIWANAMGRPVRDALDEDLGEASE